MLVRGITVVVMEEGMGDMGADMAGGIMAVGRGGEAGSMDGVMAGGECAGCAGTIRVVAGMIGEISGMIAGMIGGSRGDLEVPEVLAGGRRTG
jgi:hypothetical protein